MERSFHKQHPSWTGGEAWPIVGRERERRALRDALDEASAGSGGTAILTGEAGVGKTTIVDALAAEASELGATVLRGHCYDLSTTPAYGPWREAFRRIERSRASPLARHESPLDRLTSDFDDQQELFAAVERSVRSIARERAVVVIMEDLQWADAASLDLLRYISRSMRDVPVLLIATSRDDLGGAHLPFSRLLPALVREGRVTRISLKRLVPDEVRELVRSRYPLSPLDEQRLVAFLIGRADGNPLFVTELLRMLHEQELLVAEHDRWSLRAIEESGVPALVRQVVLRRLEQLSADARTLIDLAAILGYETSLLDLESLFPASARVLDEALEQAVQSGLLNPDADYLNVRFSHALVRQTVYDAIRPLRRRTLHRQAGDLLASRDRPDLDAVADHLYHAGDELAIDWLVRAAEHARRLFAFEMVIARCRQAIELAERLGSTAPVVAYRMLGLASEIVGELESARSTLERASELAADDGDPLLHWQLMIDLGSFWASRDYGRARQYLEQALALAKTIDNPGTLGQSLNRLGNLFVNVDQPQIGLEYHERALGIFEQLGDDVGIAGTLDLLGMTSQLIANSAKSAEYYDRAIPLLRMLGDRQTLVTALVTTSAAKLGTDHAVYGTNMVHRTLVPSEAQLAPLDEAIEIAIEMGWRAGEAFGLALRSRANHVFGNFQHALDDGWRAVERADEIDHAQWLVLALCSLGGAYLDLLDADRAREVAQRAASIAEETGSGFLTGISTSLLATAHIASGDLNAAEALIRPRIDRSRPPQTASQLNYWTVQAEIELVAGDVRDAIALLDTLDGALPGPAESRHPNMLRLRGEALTRSRQYDEAEEVLAASRASAENAGYAPLLRRVLVAMRKLSLAQGRVDDAERIRDAAMRLSDELARTVVDPESRELFRERAAAQVPPVPFRNRAHSGGGDDAITPREREVLRLVSRGLTDAEVGDHLFISPRTVGQHLRSIYSKLDVSNRTAAVRTAQDRDLI